MTEIILAECNGSCFMIGPMSHFHPLLMNDLGPDDTVTVHSFATIADVHAMWHGLFGPHEDWEQPHFVHPAILARVQRANGPMWVAFTPLSALLEAEAKEMIVLAGLRAREAAHAVLTLLADADVADTPPLQAMMALMRLQVVEDELVSAGVARDRIRRVRRAADISALAGRPAEGGEGHIEIVIGPVA